MNRRKMWLAVTIMVGLLWAAPCEGATQVLIKSRPAHPTRILAKLRPQAKGQVHAAALDQVGMAVRQQFPLVPGLLLLEVGDVEAADVDTASAEKLKQRLLARIATLQASGFYEYVEPDYIVRAGRVPTDSAFADGTLWGLQNTGQNGGVAGADIGAVGAWDITTGSTNVIVAIIDTGIRYTHKDLAAQMWRNPAEVAGNGVDDDHNGIVDDVYGFNAINDTGDPMDDNNHGTHVAGTIGAAANDGNPHVGVAWQVRLMACKFLDAKGEGNTSDAIKCMNYAIAHGARIMNCSWGGGPFERSLFDAITAARDRGVLVVTAAGNDGLNNDEQPQYPANYQVENVVAVAAIDRKDRLASFSDYGAKTVHLGAPGVEIYSTIKTSDTAYDFFAGTSMAAPHVSGVAALLLAQFPEMGVVEFKQRLLAGAVPTAALANKTVTGGRVNALNSLLAMPDGQLEVQVFTSADEVLAGSTTDFFVRVTDLVSVTNAQVQGTAPGLPPITFVNDGQAPDALAHDATYSARLNIPSDLTTLELTVTVTAPGKTNSTNEVSFPVITPPANDAFAQRLVIASAGGAMTGSNVGASREPGEPLHAGVIGGKSVWWTWTAPRNAPVTIQTAGSDFDTTLGVYTGSAVAALTKVAGDDDSGSDLTSQVSFNALSNTTYQIAVDGYNGAKGNIHLGVELGVASFPDNDYFADRSVLSGTNVTVTGSNIGASKEFGEPNHANNPGGASVWWTWTAPGSGIAIIKTDGSSFDTTLGVYTGDDVTALNRVASDDDSGEGTRSLVMFDAVPGTAYQIAVDGFDGAIGSIRLNATLNSMGRRPDNDAFNASLRLTGTNVTVSGSNVDATKEAFEPSHAGNAGGASVWWEWTPPTSSEVTLSTRGSDFDTLLAVYSGTVVSRLTRIGSNDQDPSGGNTSSLTFQAAVGTLYKIVADGKNDGFGPATGSIQLSLKCGELLEAPLNDNFTNRIALMGANLTVPGSNVRATKEPGEPNHGGDTGGSSVWWSWAAAASGPVTIQTDGSSFDTLLAVYTGTSLAGLVRIGENDDYGSGSASRVVFNAQAGETYQIAVDGYHGVYGMIVLNLTSDAHFLRPPNDDFKQFITLTGSHISLTTSNLNATKEPGEPNHAGVKGGSSIWWTWQAPENGYVTVNTFGSSFDTVLAVYTGDTVSALAEIASNDDSGDGTRSQVTFSAAAGTDYRLVVDGFNGLQGTVHLRLDMDSGTVRPINDNFSQRTPLSGTPIAVTGASVNATKEAGEPAHAGQPGGASVWWTWTAPFSGTVVISTEGSDYDTILAIYTGNSVASLTPIASDDDSGAELTGKVQFETAGGTEYQIAVDGYNGAGGTIALSLVLTHNLALPPKLSLTMVQSTAQLTLEGIPGTSYAIQFLPQINATNRWLPLTNLTLATPTQTWLDPGSRTQSQRLYRAIK